MAKEWNVSYGTAHRATHALQLHPYRIRVTHELLPLDPNQCLHYCSLASYEFYACAEAINLAE